MNGWLFNQNTIPKIPTPPAPARLPLQRDPAAFPSHFQRAQGRSGGPVWMQFKTCSSALFPASPAPSQPVTPCPLFLIPTALHPTCRCSLLLLFALRSSSLCPTSLFSQAMHLLLAGTRQCMDIHSIIFEQFPFTLVLLFSLSVSLNTACIFSELFQLQHSLFVFLLLTFFLFFFFFPHFPCFH